MNEILDNALDSLRMGLRHYLDPRLENRDKWAILELFHAIELLLKERLYQEDPSLIYRASEKPVSDDSRTVGLEEALERLAAIGLDVPDEYIAILRDLRRRRNRIEHHRFVPASSHRRVLGEALKFIGYFLEDELGEDLKDHLAHDLFHKAKELIVDYDVLVRRAESAMEAVRGRFDPKERCLLDTGTCPDCGNRTVLVGADDEPRCYFCDERVSVRQCQYCAEYVPEDDLVGSGICSSCFSERINRND
jgi:hypothetical protein